MIALALLATVAAQAMDHHHMSGTLMPTPERAAPAAACSAEHAAMGHCASQGTVLPAGPAPAPAAPSATYADRIWGAAAMASARRVLRREHGGMQLSQVMLNLVEVDLRRGRDGYRWDGEAWFGGDIDRLTVKSEGEGTFGDRVEGAEVQALYSRAIDPYFNLQAGVRQGIGRGVQRTDAVLGIEGLAPYWFDVEGALFLSDKGDLRARAEGTYDQRITQRLILQPRVELNWSAQDMRGERIGAGLSDAEVGLRLRYEIAREFAPYVGVAWERRFGRTARYARADGERAGGAGLVLGVRAWF